MRALRRCAIRCAIGSSQEVPVRDVAARVMGAYEQGGKCQTVELNSNLTPEILKTCREDTSAPRPSKGATSSARLWGLKQGFLLCNSHDKAARCAGEVH